MKTKIGILFGLLLLFAGCPTSVTHYVVKHDVPESPTFVIIPFNNSKEHVTIANLVESAIVGSGVKVYQRPAAKEVEVQKTLEGQKLQGGVATNSKTTERDTSSEIDASKAEEKKTEKYFEYSGIKADYIVHTSGNAAYYSRDGAYFGIVHIRIVRRNSEEIIISTNVEVAQLNDVVSALISTIRAPGNVQVVVPPKSRPSQPPAF